jgi:hypothetical protein
MLGPSHPDTKARCAAMISYLIYLIEIPLRWLFVTRLFGNNRADWARGQDTS